VEGMVKYCHPYIPNSPKEVEDSLLKDLGIREIEELFKDIPKKIRLNRLLHIPDASSELDIEREIEKILMENLSMKEVPTFLGGGVWPHYVPAIVDEIINRTEFLTSYTPYQPEISQGILQTLFEFQSMICELTGMEYSNCSMYDFSSSLGEAARMASRSTRRSKMLIPEYISPDRERTLRTYVEPAEIELHKYPQDELTGQAEIEKLKSLCSKDVSAVYVENPSYLGFVEEGVKAIGEIVHEIGGLLILGVDPISLGILKPPGDYGADLVIGDGQPLGLGLNLGGPSLGIMACKGDRLLRQLPGRIVGLTRTMRSHRKAFCLALQTREQHIRRERAASNICTNNALCAVAAAVYLSLLGPNGLQELGKSIAAKCRYTMDRLNSISGVEVPLFQAFHFKEFTARFNSSIEVDKLNSRLLKHGVYGGLNLKDEFPKLGNAALFCVTEVHSREDIEKLIAAIRTEVECS